MALLPAKTIVAYACQIAKCPGFTNQAGDKLNSILQALAQNYDLPQAQQLVTLNITPNGGNGQNTNYYKLTLGAGQTYLRTKEVFYNVQGTIFWINAIPQESYDKLFQGAGISNYPYWYAVDTSNNPPEMVFFPPPNLSLAVSVRTQFQPADIPTPASASNIPWFVNQDYLQTRLAAEMMEFTGDDRMETFSTRAEKKLGKYLDMVGDTEGFATTVKLDPLRFRGMGNNLPPTKTTGF